MTFLSTSLQRDSGLNGKWRGGNVYIYVLFHARHFAIKLLLSFISPVMVSACQWPDPLMELQSTTTSCGYLLAMTGMPGMFEHVFW